LWFAFGALSLQPQLTARRGDVIAFFAAERCDDTVFSQDGLEFLLSVTRRTRPFQAFNAIVWNEIDLG
jgi:hypothetical protein